MQLVIISGRSGSGKSAALHALEDLGFHAIDNLPASLLLNLVEQAKAQPEMRRIAVSIDARNLASDLNKIPNLLQNLQQQGIAAQVVYLNSNSETLLERFSATRRRHPLTRLGQLSLREAIEQEEKLLTPLAALAQLNLDTTYLSVHELRQKISQQVAQQEQQTPTLLVQSFGFKKGVPLDADLVFDVRCLPNPYWVSGLRELTGQDQEVVNFFNQHPLPQQMFLDISSFVSKWLPQYIESNRSYITLAIGCTGGRHRSVFLTERLGQYFAQEYACVQTRHRDLDVTEKANSD